MSLKFLAPAVQSRQSTDCPVVAVASVGSFVMAVSNLQLVNNRLVEQDRGFASELLTRIVDRGVAGPVCQGRP